MLPRPGQSDGSDARLLERLAARDERALAEVYDRLAPLAYSLAVAILHDRDEAEEAVADAFQQVWRTAASFDVSRGSVQGWVVTVVRSRALDRLRARKRRHQVVVPDADAETAVEAAKADPRDAPDAEAESDEVRDQVSAALAALPAAQRDALRLAYFEGLSQSEIAERLAEPLGTIKTRMRAALAALRQRLAPLRERGEL